MRRSTLVAALIALSAIGVTGCVAEPAAVETGAPSETPSTTPSATSTPSADPDDPATWVVSDEGIGPFEIGMPMAQVLSLDPEFTDYCGDESAIGPGHVYNAGPLFVVSTGTDGGAVLDLVTWGGAEGPRTAEGLGIGSTTTEVLAAYPDATLEAYNSVFLRTGSVFFGYRPNDGEIVDSGFVDDGTPKPILRLDVTDQSGLLFEYCG
ncbi:MAG: hypothetical protein ABWY03_00020 [Microbacterium sp.]